MLALLKQHASSLVDVAVAATDYKAAQSGQIMGPVVKEIISEFEERVKQKVSAPVYDPKAAVIANKMQVQKHKKRSCLLSS